MQLKEARVRVKNKMGKSNTEKPTGKNEAKKSGVVKTPSTKMPVQEKAKQKPVEDKKEEIVHAEGKSSEQAQASSKQSDDSSTKEEKKTPVQKKPKVVRTEAVVNAYNLPISSKQSFAICKFIKKKTIEKAMEDLEQVALIKKAVPMKGEHPHRKGKIMSGRFPKSAAIKFIGLLKTLRGNAIANEIENPVIVEAVANFAPRPMGRFGRTQKKRTHVTIKVKSREEIKKTKEKSKGGKK